MSRNSKNSKLIAAAREISKQRVGGNKGAAKTKPLHGKKNAWWQRFPSFRAYIKSIGGSTNLPKQ